MKATNEYRIVDDMGTFCPQRKYAGFRGKIRWKTERERYCSHYGESWWNDVSFNTRKEAAEWLGAKIAERALTEELARRGPIVVAQMKSEEGK